MSITMRCWSWINEFDIESAHRGALKAIRTVQQIRTGSLLLGRTTATTRAFSLRAGVPMQIQRRTRIALHLNWQCVEFALEKAPPVGLEAIPTVLARRCGYVEFVL
jgi:hypothetical protein